LNFGELTEEVNMWKRISAGVIGLVIVAALMQPQSGKADYLETDNMKSIDSSRVLLDSLVVLADSAQTVSDSLIVLQDSIRTLLENIEDDVEDLADLKVTTTQMSLNDTLALSDTLLIDGGDISDFSRVYVKVLADTFATDSLTMYVASSESGSWDGGNAAFFDRAPSTTGIQGWSLDELGVYGVVYPITNQYGGKFITGDHLLIMIINSNLGIGETGSESNCSGMSVWVIKSRW